MEEQRGVDPLVSVLPIHLSNTLAPNLQILQFPLLTRPLQVPPTAAQSGKKIKARIKPRSKRIEVHVPVDLRSEVWNKERGQDLGRARVQDDQERSMGAKPGMESADPRLTEVRMRSEEIQHRGAYMLGIVRDGRLYLHPVQETHQLRPSLTYLDVFHRKARRKKGDDSDSDSDEGPPPDPDEPGSAPHVKKEPKSTGGDARDVQVSVKKADDKGGQSLTGGLSAARREMLMLIRNEEEEPWQDIELCDGETEEAGQSFDSIFEAADEKLTCETDLTAFLKSIPGL